MPTATNNTEIYSNVEQERKKKQGCELTQKKNVIFVGLDRTDCLI